MSKLKLNAKNQKQTGQPGQPVKKPVMHAWMPLRAAASFALIQTQHPAKNMHGLMAEAVNDLCVKYGVPLPPAPAGVMFKLP